MLLLRFLWSEHNYTNALINEHSPYLQQHAHNPVNWYPWGKAALAKAKKENKLIFLSIGYSTCHWCHVMEDESFTDLDVAKLLNDDFVSMKVDREQYPQIDKKYQQLYRKVHGERGGWPLSVFLSPDAKVFHLATYIPKEEGYESKGLMKLLPSFVKLQKNHSAFEKTIKQMTVSQKNIRIQTSLNTKIIDKVMGEIRKQFDSVNGGFAKHPKFPEASKLELLLDIYRLTGDQKAYAMAKKTLTKMAEGGVYDQIGGGFFRYTADEAWQIPHFEKMLYTNAELISVYAQAFVLTQNPLYKKVVDETIAQMEKHYMQEGVYFSASDADSDSEEGGYFIYAYAVVKSALKERGWKTKESENALAYLGIEEDGNIDGDFSQPHIANKKAPSRAEELKIYLKSVSDKRTFPFVDKKINTAWNAMMIKALFTASISDKRYLSLAQERLDALLGKMLKNKVLYHQTLLGQIPTQKSLLEDYAFLIDALIVGYERTHNVKYLALCKRLTSEALAKFYRNKRWYLSNDGIEAYADFDDRYYTSALSVMLDDLLRMTSLTEDFRYIQIAKETIVDSGGVLETAPSQTPKLADVFLRLQKGDIIIHASKKKLLLAQDALDKVKYPFVLSQIQESDVYLACKITMCFAHDKNITALIEKIKKAVK